MPRTVPYTEYSSISDRLFGYVDTLCRNVGRLFIDSFQKFLKINIDSYQKKKKKNYVYWKIMNGILIFFEMIFIIDSDYQKQK